MSDDGVPVAYDAGLPEEHDVALYRECLDWCADAGVEREWTERCHRAGRRLDEG
ncbi:MAG: hypothetical protein V5A44_08805 [Haloarculaceae archaeon]